MSRTTVSSGASAPVNLAARFLGIITSPKDTYRAVAAHPRWLGMLAVVTVLVATFTALPMTTPEGKAAALRSQIETMEGFGLTVPDQAYEQMRRGMDTLPYTTASSVLVMTPIVTLVFAGLLYVVFNAVLGGEATFRQLFAVVVHASVITALQQIFTGPLNYFHGATSGATNLGVLLPMIDDRSFLGWALAMTDLFIIWYVLVLAIGLGVLYRRRTAPIAFTLYGIYAAVVVVVAAVGSRLGGA